MANSTRRSGLAILIALMVVGCSEEPQINDDNAGLTTESVAVTPETAIPNGGELVASPNAEQLLQAADPSAPINYPVVPQQLNVAQRDKLAQSVQQQQAQMQQLIQAYDDARSQGDTVAMADLQAQLKQANEAQKADMLMLAKQMMAESKE
ncbi:hypothetical protein [Thaumasiovibrio subtropicus]|uniref:hypothetical protein n=1 Tax=Thaumasiovibrio subtropicus TaxID=1891207 RepID=UPI000B353C52|nr:hypothetical protein [Thaumasiovibrio subtropicus]